MFSCENKNGGGIRSAECNCYVFVISLLYFIVLKIYKIIAGINKTVQILYIRGFDINP